MKKLLLPLLILSLSLSLIACGGKDEPGDVTTGTQDGTAATSKVGPVGSDTLPETIDEAAAYNLGAFVSYAEDDNFTYKIYKEGAAVSGFKGSGEVVLPDSIDGVPVKVIARDAFRGVAYLTKITLPASVTQIAPNAFYMCSGLTSITVSSGCSIGDKAFAYATSLTEANIQTTDIGTGIFYGCTALKSCTLPASLTVIPDQTFYGCTALEYSIPAGITSIGTEAFFSCTSLTEIVIPDSVHAIGDSAFYNCTGVTKLVLPEAPASASVMALADEAGEEVEDSEDETEGEDPVEGEETAEGEEGGDTAPAPVEPDVPAVSANGLVRIGDYAFYNLSGVTEVNIPSSVVYIGTFAFSGTGITSVEIPAIVPSVTYNFEGVGEVTSRLGVGAFAGCKGLTEITIPDTITEIPDMIVYGCENIATVTYNPEITRIGKASFAGTAITVVHIPDTVTAIGASCFANCTKLVDLKLGIKVANVNESAFKGCTALTSVSIPEVVTTIGESSFEGCTSLSEVVFESEKINTLFGKQCFYNCPELMSIVIPAGCTKNFNTSCIGYIPDPEGEEGDKIPLVGFKVTGYLGGSFESYAKSYAADLTAYLQKTDPEHYGEDADPVEDFLTIVGVQGQAPFADFEWDMVAASEDGSTPYGLIIKKYTGSSENVLIPATFRLNEKREISLFGIDRRVVIIGEGAFEGNTAIKSVTLPETVKEIQKDAFKGCTNLATADMRNLASLAAVGERAFLNTALLNVYLPAALKADAIGQYAFCYVQSGDGEPTVAEVASYQYTATEYVKDEEGNIKTDEEGNPTTVKNTYESEAEVPEDAVSVEKIPVPPTIYCNGTGGTTYAKDNGITSAKLPAEA